MKTLHSNAVQLTDLSPTAADFRMELLAGLRRQPRRLPCKFFYDAEGSRLFDQICDTPEYYPTRTELGILSDAAEAIARRCGPRCRLVEPGSGNSRKTRLLLAALDQPVAYVPIDISRRHLLDAARRFAALFPEVEVLPVCADFLQPIELPEPEEPAAQTVLFFPGSTIGNFEPAEATELLRHFAGWCEPGNRLLIGVDLEKSVSVLERAYDDARGVTAAFNLNLLARANRELQADFELDAFAHEAVYVPEAHRIEMRLVSRRAQTVSVGSERFRFAAGERIVTEHSHKYTRDRFTRLAAAAGWLTEEVWTDSRGWFAVFALRLG